METKFNLNLRRTGRNLIAICFLAAFMMLGTRSYGQALILDYNDMEYENTYMQSTDSFFNYVWDINKNFPNNDSTYNYDLRFANVKYDTLIDFDYNTGLINQTLPYAGHKVRLDSFQLYYNHVRSITTSADTMYMYVYDITTASTSGTAPNDVFNATWLWKDSLKVTGSSNMNTSGTSLGNGFYYLTRKPNLTLPAGHAFGIYVEFRGNKRNSFEMIGGYRDNCNKACVAAASMAGFNSDFYLDLKQGTTVYSGIQSDIGIFYDCDGSGGLTPNSCENFYIQDFLLPAYVTVTAAPTVITNAATSVTTTSATLNGSVNANGVSSTTGFQWGLTTGYTGGTVVGVPSPVTGSTATAINYALTGLTINTTYHYRALGTNSNGTTYGNDITFTTLASSNGGSCDTLFNLNGVNDVPYIVTVGVTNDSGWFAGNNFYGLLGSAEGFAVTIGDHMSAAQLGFAYANYLPADANKTVKVKVYNNTGTSYNGNAGAPGNAIDSATVTLSQIVTDINNNAFTSVNFTNNVAFTTDTVYIGVIFPTTTGDTVVLLNNFEGGDGDGWDLLPSAPAKWETYTNDWGIPNTGNYIIGIMCSSSASAQCTPAAGSPAGVSPTASSVPCVTQGTAYTESYTLVVPTTVTVGGQTLTVTSVTIDSIGNLPSGLTWMANANPATYNAGASGCYIISGTSNAACGEYLTPIYITAVTNLGTFHTTLNAAGYPNQYLQIIASPHTCPVLNTNQTTPFVADANCGVSAATGVTTTTTAVLCHGGATGSATAHATGGNGTYTYLWSNGATTASISNVIAGTYTVTVTSNTVTASASATITQPATAVGASATATTTACSSNTGTATVTATGGTPAYTYHWSNGSTIANPTTLAAATYSVTVTDANGCSTTASATVSRPAAFTVTTTPTAVACFGLSTGAVSTTTTGAVGNLTYQWSNSATTQSLTNVAATTYSVTVTDANGCSSSASASVTQPASALGATATSTITACGSNTGSATVTATGGTTTYTYLWSNGGTSTSISSIGVGNYNVTVTDAHTCTATATTSVNTSATFVVNVTPTNVNCFGQNTGGASVTVTGATGNITYAWSNGGTASSISSLAANTYNVTVTDGSGCAKTGTTTVTQPVSALSVSVTPTQTACSSNTGTATAVALGGTAGYTYLWSNSSTANPVSGLSSGSINVTVTDSKSCSATGTASVSHPSAPQVSATATAVNCFGQSTGGVTATVSGSNNDTYFWSNGATTSSISNVAASQYTVTVTDGFGCSATASATVTQPVSGVTVSTTTVSQTSCLTANGSATATGANGSTPYSYLWSNSGGSATISNLAAGNYTVTVTDNNHCSASAVASVNSPASFTIAVTTTDVTCYGANTGSATVTVTGTGNYTYLWNNSVTSATNANISAGTYNVTVTDANGCSKASSGIVTQPATALVANATATNSTCGTSSGTVSVTAVGGSGNPSYVWSANANSATTTSVSNLGVGVYSVTVTEGGCTATSSAIVNNINGPTLSILSSNPNCPGGNDGSASAVASGGTGPYTYTWSNTQTGASITGLTSGTYNLIVADNSGCQVAGSVTITAPAAIVLNPTIVDESCSGDQNGSITLAVTGGTVTYTYSWSNGSITSSISNLPAGNVSVTVTDSKHCTATSSLTVTQPSTLQISTSSTDASNGANGSATATVTGGTGPYQYNWTGSQTTSTASGLAVGQYTVTVTDASNCTATAIVTVTPTGITNIAGNITNITLIPNPAYDQVKVVVSVATAQEVEFRLVDITGKYIYTANESTVQGSVTHQINLSAYASGIYLVEITAGNEIIRKKLVITK